MFRSERVALSLPFSLSLSLLSCKEALLDVSERRCLRHTKKLSPFAVDAVYSQLHSSIQIGDRE